MKPIRINISPGELIDRMTILKLKVEHLGDPSRRQSVAAELAALQQSRSEAVPDSPDLDALETELAVVNRRLWQIEDQLRLCEHDQDFGPRFVELARSVYQNNDLRCILKHRIDRLLGSSCSEQKVYAPARAESARSDEQST